MAFSFNNVKIFIEISHHTYAIDGMMNINANGFSQIKITCNCWNEHTNVAFIYFVIGTWVKYKAVLKKWVKGTGGGLGDKSMFEECDEAKIEIQY